MLVMPGPSQKPETENHVSPSSEPISESLCSVSETYCGQNRQSCCRLLWERGLSHRGAPAFQSRQFQHCDALDRATRPTRALPPP